MGATPRVAVVADDLTSAADGSGPFVRAGARVAVLLHSAAPPRCADVVAYDLDTRHRSPDDASASVSAQMRARSHIPVLLKTIDSTLRGNVMVEVLAAARACRRPVVIAPAFPSEGRTTRNGVQLVRGVPVHETAFGQDARSPVATSDLAQVVPGCRRLDPAADVTDPAGMWFADAETDSDLDDIVARVGDVESVLWVGSPGLAAALSRTVMLPGWVGRPLPDARRVLVVVGSRHVASRAQLDRLTAGRAIEAAASDAIIAIARSLDRYGWAAATDSSTDSSAMESERRLAALTAQLVSAGSVDALIVTGGATAGAMLRRLGTDRIDILSEPEPGVIVGRAHDTSRLTLALKAGGFGDPDALVRLLGVLAPSMLAEGIR